jgi:hypothetical protein
VVDWNLKRARQKWSVSCRLFLEVVASPKNDVQVLHAVLLPFFYVVPNCEFKSARISGNWRAFTVVPPFITGRRIHTIEETLWIYPSRADIPQRKPANRRVHQDSSGFCNERNLKSCLVVDPLAQVPSWCGRINQAISALDITFAFSSMYVCMDSST